MFLKNVETEVPQMFVDPLAGHVINDEFQETFMHFPNIWWLRKIERFCLL